MRIEEAMSTDKVWVLLDDDGVISMHPQLTEAMRICQTANGNQCKVCLNHACQFHARMDVDLLCN